MLELIKKLSERGVFLSVVDDDIVLKYDDDAMTESIITEIREHKASLVSYLKKSLNQADYRKIPVLPEAADYPVSDGQRRIWILSQLEGGSLAYHMPNQVMLEGDYSKELLEQAIQQVVNRHEILRTVFREDEHNELRQVVLPEARAVFRLAYENMEGKSPYEVNEYIGVYAALPFDLGKGPLLRALLVKTGPHAYTFHFNIHHIIGDGWSLGILAKEVLECYEGLEKGAPAVLPALPMQYKDYAAWQQSELQTDRYRRHQRFWREQLSGTLPALSLPTDRSRPPIMTHQGMELFTLLPKQLAGQLAEHCQLHQSTLFMGLLSVLKALFYRYTGQEDIIIGSPVAGREHAELADQIGFYVNMLPLRTRFSGSDSFFRLLEAVRDVTLQAYQHQMYPFDRLIEDMELQRDMSRSPVFDVMMVLQNQQGKAAVNEGHLVNPVNGINEVRTCATKFDLLIEFIEREDGLHLYVQFNTDIYNKATIERLIMHYQQLLEQVVIHPELPLYALDYIQEADKQLLTTSFNQTETAYPRGTTWLDLFKETVMLYPERTALSNGNISFSYKELDELSDMVAAYLHRHYTIHNNDVIGIKLARSEWTVPAILGVLKAGAAYVPIDPSYPEERIAYITEDSGAKAVIDEDMLSDILDAIVSNARKVSFFKPVSSSDLAYVIYTSGSTGKPKGVMIEHGSLYNYLSYCAEKYFNIPGKRYKVPLFTSLSFDLTVTSIFGAFLCGGELVVYPQEMNAADMLEDIFYGSTGVNFVKCTPSHIDLLQHTGRKSPVNQVITGGEALKQQHISALQSLNTAMVIYNEYGPTEATVGCIVETLETGGSNDTVLIGKPISNMQAYILDAHQRIVPAGVTGELYLGGTQLARGYVNKEELTKSRFVAHPFENGARLYRTGDLARWLPDGNIEYLGRADDQVKINGYRIELGEVEQALLSVNGVAAAVVLAKPAGNGSTCLVGYFTGHQPVDAAALREQLLKVLPEYMVPVNFMQLDTLPLTVNGKVDKNALPVPDGLATRAAYVAPRNEVEEELVNIWQQVFNTEEKIGIRDNFIELGGNSISAIKILSKISKEYGIVISVRKMFENPTIENLANEILNAGWFGSVAGAACSGEKERIRI